MHLRVAHTLLALLLLPASAPAQLLEEGTNENVRPFFDSGYTFPGGRPGFVDGYGLGLGFEVERSPSLGIVFRLGWDTLRRPIERYPYVYDFISSGERASTIFNWSAGVRGSLRPAGTFRPYGELDLGVRVGGDIGDDEGLAVTPRVGLAWARSGGTGLSLESALNFSTREVARYPIVPIRFGVIFR